MKKIAFCFLIYDEINKERMWWDFFKNADPNKYSIYIHQKIPSRLKYFDHSKLTNTIPTKWGDISLVDAQLLMFEEALKDKDNIKFINVSNSCIPLKSFDYVYDFLTKDSLSHFDVCSHESSFQGGRCNPLLKFLRKDQIYKSSNWFVTNREHTEICVKNQGFISLFNGMLGPMISCSDEHFFITLVMLRGNINEENFKNNATTFYNWDDEDACSPKTYDEIDDEEKDWLLNSKFLFGRKFSKDCEF